MDKRTTKSSYKDSVFILKVWNPKNILGVGIQIECQSKGLTPAGKLDWCPGDAETAR